VILLKLRANGYSYLQAFAKLTNLAKSMVLSDHTLKQSRTTAFTRAGPFFEHHFRERQWSLETLGVLPDEQRKGFRRPLMQWGLKKAKEDGVAAAVVCSAETEQEVRI
jgi:GNAT superfamily N-acetyltransferase